MKTESAVHYIFRFFKPAGLVLFLAGALSVSSGFTHPELFKTPLMLAGLLLMSVGNSGGIFRPSAGFFLGAAWFVYSYIRLPDLYGYDGQALFLLLAAMAFFAGNSKTSVSLSWRR